MKKNLLRELLNDDTPTLGTYVVSPWPGMVEVIGHTGAFDYVEYDCEVSPWGQEVLDNLARAADLFPKMSSTVKVGEQGRGLVATMAIDAGFQGVFFANVRNAEEAQECVRFVRSEMPASRGVHNCGLHRIVGFHPFGDACSAEWAQAMDDIVIGILVEKKTAVDNLAEIMSVRGIDMVNFGGGDYSISAGIPRKLALSDRRKIEAELYEHARKNGIHPRAEVLSFEAAKPYLEMGVRHFICGYDTATIYQWCKMQGAEMRKLLGVPEGEEK